LAQDHQEAEVRSVLPHRLVVTQANVLRDRLVQVLLELMLLFPADGHELGLPGQKEWITPVSDGPALFRADHEGDNLFSADRTSSDELISVEQRHEPLKASGLALVRCGREQQQVRSGFSKRFAQAITSNLFGTTAEAVGFVADN